MVPARLLINEWALPLAITFGIEQIVQWWQFEEGQSRGVETYEEESLWAQHPSSRNIHRAPDLCWSGAACVVQEETRHQDLLGLDPENPLPGEGLRKVIRRSQTRVGRAQAKAKDFLIRVQKVPCRSCLPPTASLSFLFLRPRAHLSPTQRRSESYFSHFCITRN